MLPWPVLRAVLYTALTVAVAAPLWLFLSSDAAWAAIVLGLALQLAYHLRQWVVLERWSVDPCPDRELGGAGAWYEPFSRIYRHERELRREIDYWRAELARFAAAGQALTFGIVAVSEGWRIEWCNHTAEHQLGIDQRSDLGQPITHLVRQPAFVSYLNLGDFSSPMRLRSERWGDRVLSIHVVQYGDNRHLIQISDITQSERLDQTRRDFVANVSHELRTPLTVVSGFIETLRDIELDAAERRSYLDLMGEQSERMLRIVRDLLTLSSLESAPPPDNERIDMASFVEKLKRDASALSNGRHDILLVTKGSGDLLGSESEIASALGNLVSNAVRYTPTGGRVTLKWQVGAEGATFSVEDTGIGIDPKHIPRLTERFYRVDRGRSRESGGTGLGLAIVKHALSRHQGRLEITSQPGQGSCFSAVFPRTRLVGV